MASKAYRDRQLARRREWSRRAHAAKERKRLTAGAGEPGWRMVRSVWLEVWAAPDGRTMEFHVASEQGQWRRCGFERAARGALADIFWRMKK